MCEDKDAWMKEKVRKSREARTTSVFYDDVYWNQYWQKRFNVEFNEDDKAVITENEKKYSMYIRYFGKASEKWSVLEAGCSFGFFVSFLRKKEIEAFGIDISDFAVSKTPDSVKEYVKIGSVTNIPMNDKSVDLVVCFDILEHLFIEEIFMAVKELQRVAKRGIFIKLPTSGFDDPFKFVPDRSFNSKDKSHIGVYPFEFWAKVFSESGEFKFNSASLWRGDVDNGRTGRLCLEAWIGFVRSE